ncbi:peptidoglycan editing factor PgeF [Pacificimonas sp. ICDLI1SI03]
MTETVPHISVEALGVPNGFFGREGGVSTGVMASLQCGFGADDPEQAIAENRRRVADTLVPGASLSSLNQVHGTDVVTLTEPISDSPRPKADAMVTDRPGLLLGILNADCTPILFSDVQAGVVGAAHAGWKGALANIAGTTVAAMEALGAERDRIIAAVGPCIARASYEVDEGFFQRFLADDPAHERFFTAGRPGHHQFELEAFNGARLAAAGLTRVILLGEDTYAQENRYYSYRRSTHRAEPDYGRQISVIGLPLT